MPEVRDQCYTDRCLTWDECGGAVPPLPEPCSAVEPGEFGDCRAIIGYAYNGDGTCSAVGGCECDERCVGRVFDSEAECQMACIPPPVNFCGGIAAIPCPDDLLCVDNPGDGCDPANGGADCGGICIDPGFCGGFGGFPCEPGFDCIDDPRDDCDPAGGGADCGGICVPNGCPDADADGRCDVDDSECNADGSLLMCRRAAPPCGRGTVPEVRNGCYTNACVTWEQCGSIIEPPLACLPIEPGEFGDCDALIGVGVGPDGTCQAISGCGCNAGCDGRVFDTIEICEARCGAGPLCLREAAVSPRDPLHDRYEGIGFANACRADADCFLGGCSGEICSAEEGVVSTCELIAPAPGACGCVEGECIWYVNVCGGGCADADVDGICDVDDGECNLDGQPSVCDRIPPRCRAPSVPEVTNGCYTGACVGWDTCVPNGPPPPDGQACGGFVGARCPDGQACIDAPRDDCDPANGGADCPGICVAVR